jgi:large subunit ribosomal protein LP0
VPAGRTGLDPAKTGGFAANNIATKISRGEIEIIYPVPILKVGQVVSESIARLIHLLKPPVPPRYIEIKGVFSGGIMMRDRAFSVTVEDILQKLANAALSIAGLALQIYYPILPSAMFLLTEAFRSVIAVAIQTEVTFRQAEKIKDFYELPQE